MSANRFDRVYLLQVRPRGRPGAKWSATGNDWYPQLSEAMEYLLSLLDDDVNEYRISRYVAVKKS